MTKTFALFWWHWRQYRKSLHNLIHNPDTNRNRIRKLNVSILIQLQRITNNNLSRMNPWLQYSISTIDTFGRNAFKIIIMNPILRINSSQRIRMHPWTMQRWFWCIKMSRSILASVWKPIHIQICGLSTFKC